VRLIGPNVDPPVWDCPAFGATTIEKVVFWYHCGKTARRGGHLGWCHVGAALSPPQLLLQLPLRGGATPFLPPANSHRPRQSIRRDCDVHDPGQRRRRHIPPGSPNCRRHATVRQGYRLTQQPVLLAPGLGWCRWRLCRTDHRPYKGCVDTFDHRPHKGCVRKAASAPSPQDVCHYQLEAPRKRFLTGHVYQSTLSIMT